MASPPVADLLMPRHAQASAGTTTWECERIDGGKPLACKPAVERPGLGRLKSIRIRFRAGKD